MKITEMIAEWRKGCSNSMHDNDGNPIDQKLHPEYCSECTLALIDAIEREAERAEAADLNK